MKVRRVEIENFACYQQRAFDLHDLSVVLGENRSGKSSLVYSIYFALYGQHLNRALRADDLCRKGEKAGTIVVEAEDESGPLRLRRGTTDPDLVERWRQVDGIWAEDQAAKVFDLAAETASLTSFFREGELIYFLQDIPRYNKTLLQSVLDMDDALVTGARLKKALGLANKHRDDLKRELARTTPPRDDAEALERRIADLEKQLEQANQAQQANAGEASTKIDFAREHELRKQAEDLAQQRKQIDAQLDKLPAGDELQTEQHAAMLTVEELQRSTAELGELSRRLGSVETAIQDAQTGLDNLQGIAQEAQCPTCGRPVEADWLAALLEPRETEYTRAKQEKDAIERELARVEQDRAKLEEKRSWLLRLKEQQAERGGLEERLRLVDERFSQVERELEPYERARAKDPNLETDARTGALGQANIHELQRMLVDAKVEVAQALLARSQSTKQQAELRQAVRLAHGLAAACDAFKETVADFNRDLLGKIRSSLHSWSGHFEFLKEFDIELTAKDLSPIVQARGYQYKLNQMSKSERIFLYLLLKLALGDTLGQLGAFVLDDPADGLDGKRKELLAHLLTKVRERRQVIVTTNDPEFAAMFAGEALIAL